MSASRAATCRAPPPLHDPGHRTLSCDSFSQRSRARKPSSSDERTTVVEYSTLERPIGVEHLRITDSRPGDSRKRARPHGGDPRDQSVHLTPGILTPPGKNRVFIAKVLSSFVRSHSFMMASTCAALSLSGAFSRRTSRRSAPRSNSASSPGSTAQLETAARHAFSSRPLSPPPAVSYTHLTLPTKA